MKQRKIQVGDWVRVLPTYSFTFDKIIGRMGQVSEVEDTGFYYVQFRTGHLNGAYLTDTECLFCHKGELKEEVNV